MAFYDIFLENNVYVSGILLVIIFFLNFKHYITKTFSLPPGPWGIPYFGYWPFLRPDHGHLQLQELTEKYGEVFSLTSTGNLCICLNSIRAVKEAHLSKSDCFADRFSGYSLLTLSFEEGVSMVNGESWKVQRKFFSQLFKEYGLNAVKENAAGSLYDALSEIVEELRATKGQPTVITELLTVKCARIMRRILFNDQGITDEELKEMNHEYGYVISSMTYKNLLIMGEAARLIIFPFMPSYWAMRRGHDRIQAILTKVINRHKQSFDESQIMDIIDCYFKEKRDKEAKGDPTAKYFTDKALLSSVYQFVTDGVLTVSYFIGVFLQYLVKYPDEQEKIYQELLEVVGPNRQPSMEDKSNLPYTTAFIYEAIRTSSDSFPMFPSLTCTKETTIQGHKIPKGAVTVLNIYSAHHDPQSYEDPHKFDPSRFITQPGKQRPDLPIMFGIGKRACMGEPFTMIQNFLFLTTIVKNFRLTVPDEFEGTVNFLTGDIKICAHPRM